MKIIAYFSMALVVFALIPWAIYREKETGHIIFDISKYVVAILMGLMAGRIVGWW